MTVGAGEAVVVVRVLVDVVVVGSLHPNQPGVSQVVVELVNVEVDVVVETSEVVVVSSRHPHQPGV